MIILILYQHENDNDIGVAVIDSFTHHILQFMEGIDKTSQVSMQDLVSWVRSGHCYTSETRLHSSTAMSLTKYILMRVSAQIFSGGLLDKVWSRISLVVSHRLKFFLSINLT